jgi:hypothetical protein
MGFEISKPKQTNSGEKMKKLAVILTLVVAHQATATTSIWKGEGSMFNQTGTNVGQYELTVTNNKNAEVTESKIQIKTANGNLIEMLCTNTENKDGGWASICGQSKGGGRCFGEGLCISYSEDGNGKAYATTIVMDGASDMRLLRTELENGKAIRFFREKLHKQ